MAKHVDFDRLANALARIVVSGYGSEDAEGLYAICTECQQIVVVGKIGDAWANELLLALMEHDCSVDAMPVVLSLGEDDEDEMDDGLPEPSDALMDGLMVDIDKFLKRNDNG